MGIFDINNKNRQAQQGTKKIQWVIEYVFNGKKNQIIDYFPINFTEAEARKYVEKKIGTFQFTLISIYEY